MEQKPHLIPAEHIARAWMMLSHQQQVDAMAKALAMHPDLPPVVFPCPPVCPPVNA